MTWEHGIADYGIVRHPSPAIAVGDHVHMAAWWLRREHFADIEGRVVSISPLGTAKVATPWGETLKVHVTNLEHARAM